jgi:methionine aminotransferase
MEYKGSLTSKLPQVGTTIFTTMSALAAEHGALNLSQGFPDFPASRELIGLVNKYMWEDKNQYAPLAGVPELRHAISQKVEQLYGTHYNPETEITITAGGTQGLATAISSIIREGDEAIIFTPAYDSYAPIIELNGGRPVYIKLKHPDYHIDWDELKKMISLRTRLIIINSPHNPTGAMLTATDLEKLTNLVRGSNILILSDEVYEHITFDGRPHLSMASVPELAERSFIVFSFGKTFHVTGWKVGCVLAPENMMREFRKVHQFEVFCVNTPIQYAIAEYLKNEENYLISNFYQTKRDRFIAAIQGSRFHALPCSGTYFQLLEYSAISQEKDTDFALTLIKEHGIAGIPVSVFYNVPEHNHVLRFCFAKQDETLDKAGEILRSI